ncbi:MAG: hypothetical protein HZC01_04275 [Candidatus Kerfeldbacteria bacterium]|nr:hypothetical protein [Candidatus Kerfeldbacteria bacterium]
MDSFTNMIGFLIPFGMLALLACAIAAIIEGKNMTKKGSVIRSLYFYLASLVTLAIVVGSVIFLINLGLKVWVFTDANTNANYYGPPPSLSLDSGTTTDPAKVEAGTPTVLACTSDCTLTAIQKESIESWKTSYTSWQDSVKNVNGRNARDAVAALSFLIVALPFFIIHYRIVQRDHKNAAEEEKDKLVIRPTYFYFVSLGSLLMIVIAGGFLINLVLKTWVFPAAGEADDQASRIYATEQTLATEKSAVVSITECGAKCGLDAETVALASQWVTDYDNWQKESNDNNNVHRQAAGSIPYILVGLPLLWYHWSAVRREAKDKKVVTPVPPTQS